MLFAVVACYGTVAMVSLLSLAGITVNIHEGAWATVIVVFAWIAVLAMGVNMRRHRGFGPFIMSDVGAILISWVMFVDYSRIMELTGFVLLIVAAFWDRQRRMRTPAASQNREQETE